MESWHLKPSLSCSAMRMQCSIYGLCEFEYLWSGLHMNISCCPHGPLIEAVILPPYQTDLVSRPPTAALSESQMFWHQFECVSAAVLQPQLVTASIIWNSNPSMLREENIKTRTRHAFSQTKAVSCSWFLHSPFSWSFSCSLGCWWLIFVVCVCAGHVSKGGHGGADRHTGEALPERPARGHVRAWHQRQAGEWVGQQGGVPQTGL